MGIGGVLEFVIEGNAQGYGLAVDFGGKIHASVVDSGEGGGGRFGLIAVVLGVGKDSRSVILVHVLADAIADSRINFFRCFGGCIL